MSFKKGTEVPTIDVVLVTVETSGKGLGGKKEIALTTANKIGVEVQEETKEATKLIVKGVLIAQKGEETTITGHKITLTDNVFNYELAQILQGGKLKYWTTGEHDVTQEEETSYGVAGYTPPVSGSKDKGEVFTLNSYSAIYNAAGVITGYEKISYPNCKGKPFGLNSEDGVFRVSEYTIMSAPAAGQEPFDLVQVKELPVVS